MAFPESFLQDLKMRNDITDVVSGYVNLKRRGRNMVGLCPFHGEKTPSFNVYTENGFVILCHNNTSIIQTLCTRLCRVSVK
jgi:DNA primase